MDLSETDVVTSGSDPYEVKSLMRGLELLKAFTPARQNLSLSDLADAVGVTQSAIFRIIYTLMSCGLIVRNEKTATYSLGAAVMQLGYGFVGSRTLVQAALPGLEYLRDSTGWSAHLGVLDGRSVVYQLRLPMHRAGKGTVHVGCRLPAHVTAMGRVLLADLPEEHVITLYRGTRFVGANSQAPRNLPALLTQLKRDQKQGFVAHVGGFERHVASVSAPLRDPTGRTVAAINLAAHVRYFPERAINDAMIRKVLNAASEISTRLRA